MKGNNRSSFLPGCPVEILTGIPEGTILTVQPLQESTGNTFLQVTPTDGGSSAIVSTSKPLDADSLVQLNRRTLQINDLNDNTPVFQGGPYNKEITEALAVGSSVLRVTAVDADATNANNVVSYSIQAPQPPEFSIDTSGVIKLVDELNYNAATSYTFTVIARDPPGLTATAAVTVTVADYDDLNPYFDHNVYTGSIMENGVGEMTSVLPEAIKAQDGDKGINQPVVYSITSVDPSEFRDKVDIDPNTGVILVIRALDREQVSSFNIQIKAEQNNDPAKAAYALVVVNVGDRNDNPPEFDKTAYNASIPENSPNGYFVLQTKVTDKDLGGFIGTLRLIPDTVPFTISNDGIITVKTSADLDRETSPSFTFQVEAREDESPNHTETADVVITLSDVNDNSPQFSSSKYEGKVFSNQTVGMNVVKVEATDADEGVNGEVTYSIDAGNEDDHFALDENSGDITLAKVIILEDNTVKRFSLYVTARDGGEMSRASSAPVAIQAPGNSDPQFLATTYHGTVEEEQNPPINIVKVAFYSVGSVVPVTLQVNTHQDLFSIDNNGELFTKAKLDYEDQANYTVSISLSDGTKSDTAEVKVQVLDVNDNSPVFVGNPFTFTLSEDVKLGTNVTVLTATDADSGFNGEVRYSIQGGGGSFGVDPETGRITVDKALDREEADEITFKVVAADQGRPSRSATADVTVTVTDVNDNNPVFAVAQHFVTVSEIDEPGLVLVKLNATDADDGVNAAVTYLIAKQDPTSEPPAFAVDAVSGELTLTTKLDFGNATRYVLTVEAVDGGTPTLTGIATVTVQVEDVNNNPPEFSQEQYDVAVPENLAGGAVVVSLEVTDKDKDGFSNGHFLMTSDTFNINKMGAISLNSDATLDRESQDTYMLQVVAVDQPVGGLSATAQVNITITDINDNNPEFLPLPDPIAIAEGDYSPAEPGIVCVIEAEDKDVGDNGRVTLSTSSNHTFTFKEDGTLIAVTDLDREKQDSYDLVIVATDHGKPQRQTVTNIRVTVTDVNDNDPVFSMETYSKSILAKDAKKGDLVLTIAATDKDAGNNSLITYSITDGASEYISLDPDSGDLVLTSDLAGITEDMLLNITAQAQDQGKPPRSSTATVLIFIRTVSLEDGLAFSRPTYNFSVLEHMLSGSEVGVVLASSGSPLFTVSYTLKTHQDAFSIDSSGLILTRVELDMETEALYVLSVEANDTRTPPNTALTVVTVQVKNVNEVPVFDNKTYKAEIFSNAPFKTPVVQVKATDPDVGDMLQYSLVEPNSMFDIEPSSGQVYVVSLEGESGKETLEVKAEDKHGLYATATVEVTVNEVEDTNVVVISLNQPINAVEKKAPELEQVLGWTVRIVSISTSNGGASDRSAPIGRESRTYVSFVAMDTSGTAITAEKVKSKLTEEEEQVQSELEKVFGSDLEHEVERGPGESVSNPMQIAVIALSVLLGLSIVGIIVLTVVSVKKSSGKVNPANSAQSSPQSQRRASKVSKREDNTSEEGSDTDRL
ncbi:protocadherin Fat 4 [Engraulis encrasicolus]|uniref:protocadherin Fat 4 n=1 Tax=Engraulis encrasicolus TaxID=184585 RepID=UPI002FD17F8B